MTPEQLRQHLLVVEQLNESLMTAAMCAEKLRTDLSKQPPAVPVNSRHDRLCPFVDPARWQLVWSGKRCDLGCTVLYRLAQRLTRRVNYFVTSEQLLRDVWFGDTRSVDTVRSAVRHLRERLCAAGMEELARSIQSRGGGYAVLLQ